MGDLVKYSHGAPEEGGDIILETLNFAIQNNGKNDLGHCAKGKDELNCAKHVSVPSAFHVGSPSALPGNLFFE